ncbi:MAG: ASPIC/UnbV domain-containing protein, partial [Bryobacteraceae bacterium]|nr:ASPIC/UnbV domain-containing protein [Bryobacteraceae bacterium]
ALHRGAAFGDLDGDGGIDVVLTRLNEGPVVLRNAMPRGNWVRFRVPLGTVVRVGDQWNSATQAVGYASSSDPVVHFGLGAATEARDVEIRTPGGKVEKAESLPAGSVHSRRL